MIILQLIAVLYLCWIVGGAVVGLSIGLLARIDKTTIKEELITVVTLTGLGVIVGIALPPFVLFGEAMEMKWRWDHRRWHFWTSLR